VAELVEEDFAQPQWHEEFELISGGASAPFPEEHSRAAGYHGDRLVATGSMNDGGSSGQAPVAPSGGHRISFKGSKNIERPRGVTEW